MSGETSPSTERPLPSATNTGTVAFFAASGADAKMRSGCSMLRVVSLGEVTLLRRASIRLCNHSRPVTQIIVFCMPQRHQ